MSNILRAIQAIKDLHPAGCIFMSNEAIVEMMGEYSPENFIDAFAKAELYCQHENINRLPTI